MRQGRKVILIIVCGCILIALISSVLFGIDKEPEYQGRSLSEWLVIRAEIPQFPSNQADITLSQETETAIRAIGTNGFPTNLKLIAYEPSRFRKEASDLVWHLPVSEHQRKSIFKVFNDRERKAHAAMMFSHVVHSNASPLFPQLVQLLKTRPRPLVRTRVAYGLAEMGPVSMPAIKEMFADTNLSTGLYLPLFIGAAHHEGVVDWSGALPLILTQANANDPLTARFAIEALGRMKIQPERCIPLLTNKLQSPIASIRETTAKAIGEFGPQATSAIPALVPLLNDPESDVREAVTNAINKIAPDYTY